MFARYLRNTTILVILILVVIGGIVYTLLSPVQVLGNQVGNDPYPPPGRETPFPTAPLPTPQPKPNPTPTSYPPPIDPTLSPQALAALQFVADREGVPTSDLIVSNEFPIGYKIIDKQYKAITIYHRVDLTIYRVLVDLDDTASQTMYPT